MRIKNLSLQNIRLFPKKSLSFTKDLTVIYGPNASGKTNLLEAIFLLSLGKSFHAESEKEMISFSKDVGRISGEVEGMDEELTKLEIVLTTGDVMDTKTPIKKQLVNGVPRRMQDFIGKIKVVLFWPQDMDLVTDSPSLRRRYLDYVLVQTDHEYRRTLISYERGLRQRNRLLGAIRDNEVETRELLFWDQLLVKNGEYITRKREEYISYINKIQIPSANWRTKFQMNYQMVYDKSEISQQRLLQYHHQEIAAAATLVGPHRDDLEFKIKNKVSSIKSEEYRSLARYGSRGEQRLAVLWLKLGELAYIKEKSRENPVLLLDDILSELDHGHRDIIFEIIGDQQTIMTLTDKHFITGESLKNVQMIEL